jgi:Na+-transporting NADH:ubiquinone oxidoreductase subunit D
MNDSVRTLVRPLIDENPITLQILGICSALAVTRSLDTALVMCAALTSVLTLSNGSISLIRRLVPRSVRLIVQITIIATLVIVADQLLKAYAWELSRRLSIFVGLIISNCIVLGRAETFAMSHGVRASLLDGLGNGLGYSLILIAVASLRELLGSGTLLGIPVLLTTDRGGAFEPIALMLAPPSAFFVLGLLVWGIRSWRTQQVEAPEYALPEGSPAATPAASSSGGGR